MGEFCPLPVVTATPVVITAGSVISSLAGKDAGKNNCKGCPNHRLHHSKKTMGMPTRSRPRMF